MNNQDISQMVFEKIGDLLDNVGKWDNGRVDCFYPMNASTHTAYHGSNIFTLGMLTMMSDFKRPHFMTFNQAKSHDGQVIKGSKGFPVVFWKQRVIKDGDDEKIIPMLRYFTVFNIDQISGLHESFYQVKESDAQIEAAPQMIVERFFEETDGIGLKPTFGSPYYSPPKDEIGMPEITFFTTSERYYESFFHEMVHSTGHETRLDRNLQDRGKESYAKEELIAEYGAAMLMSKTGSAEGFENLAAYLKHWWHVIGENPKDLLSAAGKATKAVDYIINLDA